MAKKKVKSSVILKVCADQVEALITMPRLRNTEWTAETLHKHLIGVGLDYTLEEVEELYAELSKRGIIEDAVEV
ncbi:unnamed protein product [marine sediment metagenome]|uniref:Uncharacterized protein n=1 Tax=marine sediment metagenome TaxID=412755 RepID=X1RRR3_9ZZZZ